MKRTVYYAFFPKLCLQGRVRELGADRFAELWEPRLWSLGWPDRIPYERERIDDLVKLVFVADIKYNTLLPHEVEEVFGKLDVSTESFDKWWDMWRFHGLDFRVVDVLDTLLGMECGEELRHFGFDILHGMELP